MNIKDFTFSKLTNRVTKRKSRDSNAVSHSSVNTSDKRVEDAKRRLVQILNHDLGTRHTSISWIALIKIEETQDKPRDSIAVTGWKYGRFNTTSLFSKNFIDAMEKAIESRWMEPDDDDIISSADLVNGKYTIRFEHLGDVETRLADTRYMPVAIFTLCDTPDQGGYGCNSDSAAKVCSLLLQQVAVHVNMKRNVTKESLSTFYDTYNYVTINKDTEGWVLLDVTVKEIEAVLQKADNGSVDSMKFIA